MLVNPANITEKKYKKLTVKVAPGSMAFCSFDTLNQIPLAFREIAFDPSDKKTVVEYYADAFASHEELGDSYDEVVVLHDNNLATFVPAALFDEDCLGNYLQFNNKVFETDSFAFDTLASYQMNTVYIPYADINNFFVDTFGNFVYKHAHTALVSKLLELSKNVDEKKMFVHMAAGHFEIVMVQNQHLLLFNSFDYKTPEDLIYYLLFTAEQLNLNPETFRLEFLGDISQDDAFFAIAYKYIRNVSLFDTADLEQKNALSAQDNRRHFILLQS
ncbi:MAG TPA: DUF3822 family protein [Flavobacterium sp.]|nr:DUF3822 family protein [Flavobacterium sp.]HPJ10092.1 DUF3822 family protein [Flavobacterium sp.]